MKIFADTTKNKCLWLEKFSWMEKAEFAMAVMAISFVPLLYEGFILRSSVSTYTATRGIYLSSGLKVPEYLQRAVSTSTLIELLLPRSKMDLR
jgi:hypothetical protein